MLVSREKAAIGLNFSKFEKFDQFSILKGLIKGMQTKILSWYKAKPTDSPLLRSV